MKPAADDKGVLVVMSEEPASKSQPPTMCVNQHEQGYPDHPQQQHTHDPPEQVLLRAAHGVHPQSWHNPRQPKRSSDGEKEA